MESSSVINQYTLSEDRAYHKEPIKPRFHKKQLDKNLKRFKIARDNAYTDIYGDVIDDEPCIPDCAIHAFSYKLYNLSNPAKLKRITDKYLKWVTDTRYHLFLNTTTQKVFSLPAAKRGNGVYAKRVKDRFDVLKFAIPKTTFFDSDFAHRGPRNTPLVFVTLTYDQDKYGLDIAWEYLSKNYNRFVSKLRRAYPGVRVGALRGNESHRSGYPHIHCLISFSSAFPVHRHVNKNNKQTWRISYGHKQKLSSCWCHGFSDVVAMHSSQDAISYVAKYITKGLTLNFDQLETPEYDSKALTALAIQWVKGMRSFSFSKVFLEILGGRLERVLHNSNTDWIYLGTFPPCFKVCIEQHGEIPEICPFLRKPD